MYSIIIFNIFFLRYESFFIIYRLFLYKQNLNSLIKFLCQVHRKLFILLTMLSLHNAESYSNYLINLYLRFLNNLALNKRLLKSFM